MAKDLELDPLTRDLVFDDNGDLALIDGTERMVQQAAIRLRTFQGEWFADERVGMPYYQRILGVKPLSQAIVVGAIREQVLAVEGVRDIYDVTFSYDPSNRSAAVTFRAVDDGGDMITFDEAVGLG